jgi:ParB-like chromosome segregation protein Spo0J
MLKSYTLDIEKIRVPAKRAKTLEPEKVNEIAESILEEGMNMPIQVRTDGDGYVLIEGLHRLEAKKALGETKIESYLVQARKH